MEKIASFKIDHDVLVPGIYLSRRDGDIDTYDVRFIKPNTPPFLSTGGLHALEHIMATRLRWLYPNNTIYVGPMGCRTGMYCIFRGFSEEGAYFAISNALQFVAEFEGEIPGGTAIECGNFRDLNLEDAKVYANSLLECLSSHFNEDLIKYPTK